MQGYQQFAVYSLRDKQPVFTDGSESQVLRTVDRNTRLNVVRREGAHYMVRVLNQIAFVPVDDVSSDRSGQPVAKFGDWTATELKDAPGAAYSGGGSSGANYAGYGFEPADFTTRFLGYLIDWVLSFIAGFIVGVLFLFAFAPSSEAEEPSAGLTFGLYAVTFAVSFSYFWFMDAIGGTVGKMVMGVHVIDDATGKPPGVGKAFVRNLVRLASGIAFCLGFLWMLWDSEKKTWHDKAAGTSAVKYR